MYLYDLLRLLLLGERERTLHQCVHLTARHLSMCTYDQHNTIHTIFDRFLVHIPHIHINTQNVCMWAHVHAILCLYGLGCSDADRGELPTEESYRVCRSPISYTRERAVSGFYRRHTPCCIIYKRDLAGPQT